MNSNLFAAFLCCPLIFGASTFSIALDKQMVTAGDRVTLSTNPPQNGASWSIQPAGVGMLSATAGASAIYTPPKPIDTCIQIEVTATVGSESHHAYIAAVADAPGLPQEVCPGGSVTRSIVGMEQAGASSAAGSQKLFVDLFRSAALYGPGLRWWTDVRIASFPEQVTTPASQFNPVKWVANIPVNKLAQYGEFRTGIEQRIARSKVAFLPSLGARQERNTLGLFVDFGALGNIGSPASIAQVFNVPPVGTPQASAFNAAFPKYQIPPGTQYIAFTPPDRDRFFLEYAAGFRLTTRFIDAAKGVLPESAMLSVAFGQNELIAAGKRQGVVGTFEGFYPLPIPGGFVYLFGRADLRLGRPSPLTTPLALTPAEATVLPSDPGVAIVALSGNRDLYSIGIGLDAIQLIASIMNKTGKN